MLGRREEIASICPDGPNSFVVLLKERLITRSADKTKRQIMATQTLENKKRSKIQKHKIATQKEWLAARKDLLKKEKAITHARDELSAERRKLPWLKIEKNYVFDTPEGKKSLPDLFNGRSQLVIYHFMFGPDWKEGCPSCSFVSDHVNGALP